MKPNNYKIIFIVLLLGSSLFFTEITSAQIQVLQRETGPGYVQHPDEPCVPPGFYEQYEKQIATNIEKLAAEGKLIGTQSGGAQTYDWPLTHETNFYGNDYFFIQNYVDHDTVTGSISEYMCGNRSYDLASGYDHQGTDICIGPYWWNMMDDMKVRIIAGAPGQIVGRVDGNGDRNCGFNSGTANSITIQHDNGSRALYLHMKSGSLTDKQIGDFVVAGEFLGYVGSSGSSTNPHLHFEVRDPGNNVVDPWVGPCNPDIFSSLWNAQKPYPNSGIMSILTMSGSPANTACPDPEIVPYSNHFDQGAFMRVEIHLRDLVPGSTSLTRIYNPFGNVILTFNDTIGNTFWAGNWVGFTFNLPNNTPIGTYRILVEYAGKTAAHYFTVGCPGAYNLSGAISAYKGYVTGTSITSTHTIGGSSANNIWYEAADYIVANPGFRATRNCRFRARIDECAENSTIASRTIQESENIFKLGAFPTVTSEQTKLILEISQNEMINIDVYDLTGRKVKSLIADQNTISGVHEFKLDVTEFNPGVYIGFAEAGGQKSQCRFVVQR